MASATNLLEAPIPKPVLWIGTPIAAIVLITFFVFMGFPYDQLADTVAREAGQASNLQVTIGGISPRMTIGGPGFTAHNLTLTSGESQTTTFDEVKVRPAWSLSWFRAEPALFLELTSDRGNARGTLIVASEPSWAGQLTDLDLARLPMPLPADSALSGMLNANVDITMTETGAEGTISFAAASGTISHASIPVDIEFDVMTGSIVMGGEKLAEIHDFELQGPILVATAEGDIIRGKRAGQNQLDIDVGIQITNPGMQSMLKGMGLPLDGEGRTEFVLGGSTSNPKLR
jgi:type II secretion system protein N